MAFKNGICQKIQDNLNEIYENRPFKKLDYGILAPFTLEEVKEFEKNKNKITFKQRGNELHTK